MGCNCDGCDKCDRPPISTSTPAKTTQKLPTQKLPKQYSVSDGEDAKNTWTKIPGMRCARDNRDHFWYAEWWYNSIISHQHASMEECQKDCERNPYCNACDYWPARPRPQSYGAYRSFFLCDLRDGAPCEENDCSHVMLLDRKDKNWVVKARQCATKETCGYTEKMARGMHYDWYFLYQGGMVSLVPDSEEETYTCTRHSLQQTVQTGNNALAPGNYGAPTTTTTTITNAPSAIFGPGNAGPCLQWKSKEVDVWRWGKKAYGNRIWEMFLFLQEINRSLGPGAPESILLRPVVLLSNRSQRSSYQ